MEPLRHSAPTENQVLSSSDIPAGVPESVCNEGTAHHGVRPKSRLQGWKRRCRYFYLRFMRMQGTPAEIARGLAAGIFAGMFPLFGLQTLIGIAIATLLRGNRIMAAAGTWISNPFTYVPIYAANLQLGVWLLGAKDPIVAPTGLMSWEEILALGIEITVALFLGCTVVGLISAIIGYVLGLRLVQILRRRRRRT